MNVRFVTFSLATAVGVCFATSQLSANEPAPPDEVTQDASQPLASDACGVERTVLEAWMICEGWMPYEEILTVDEEIEPTLANESEPQESDEGFDDESDGFVYADEAVEYEDVWVAEETVADEFVESDEEVSEETEQVEVSDEQIFEEAVAEDVETTEEEVYANEELTAEDGSDDGFYEWFGENEFAADESIQEEADIEEAVEAAELEDDVELVESAADVEEADETIESVEVEATVDVVEAAIEDVVPADVTDNVEAKESVDVEVTDAVVADDRLVVEAEVAEGNSLESGEGDVATEEAIEEETAIEEVQDAEVEGTDESIESVEDEGIVDEDTIEEQVFDEVAIDAYEDLTADGVVDNEETLEVAEPPVEEAELQEPASESFAADEVNETETGTVRSFELGDCKITIQSERQLDDFELLSMLWDAVDQLEAEMD